ncbi:hypothetical protein [Bacillus sp. SN10]|uniref:hypothetical protein n=1 Tax=Bacillus sp. SN10 TaxID=2056493 RepID=UPI000C325497|nr:hypothetical protein [Bacillus sp. SN10]MRD38732.1 hypothetical protein [Bacillus thuringiensis]PKJ52615.1 hypothetical protein CWE34_26970 [Bacillus sp. SN10]
MKKLLIGVIYLIHFSILYFECSVIKRQIELKWNTLECYVQIKGNESKLNAIDLKGGKIKIYFSTLDKVPDTSGIYRVYAIKRIDFGGFHLVKGYEKAEETELPNIVKDKIKTISPA